MRTCRRCPGRRRTSGWAGQCRPRRSRTTRARRCTTARGRRARRAGCAIVALGRAGEPDVRAAIPSELLSGFVRHPAGARQLLVAVRSGYREAAARAETARARAEAASRGREIGELTRIGVALGTERDLDSLLDLILTQARRITSSDAGSLYLIDGQPGPKP